MRNLSSMETQKNMSTIEKAAARLVTKPAVALPDANPQPETSGDSYAESPINREVSIGHPTATQHIRTCELDFPWLKENGFLVPGHDNRQQAQEFRRIKRPLLLNTQAKVAANYEHPTNLMFVTSAAPGEGKTFVSLNLALSLAGELDRSVLLIDGDAAKGDMSKWMGIAGEKGLVDLLNEGSQYAEDAVIHTNVEGLSVLPCGQFLDNLDELYASDLMDDLLESLASFSHNRIIVVDGPPLLATTEASVLAQHMGQTVMVVEANKTPQSAVEQAVETLESCQLVSLLLNKASGAAAGGYGYGYGYGNHDVKES